MRKYLLTTLAVILALNSQTFLFAKESSKKTGSNASFEQFLPSKNFTAQDFKNLLSDNSSIALEKIFLVPTKKTTDNTYIKNTSQDNYYKTYQSILANPSASADFNLTKPELENLISNYKNKIVKLLKESPLFVNAKAKRADITLADFIAKRVNVNLTLLTKYYGATGTTLYTPQESTNLVNIKHHKDWPSDFLHQKMLIEVAALRVIEATLNSYNKNHTAISTKDFELALFDIVSISRTSRTETNIKFDNGVLYFNLSQDAYKYVPFGTMELVNRDAKFMTALEEIAKKRNNPSYDFTTKKVQPLPERGGNEKPTPSVYDSPYGAGSVR